MLDVVEAVFVEYARTKSVWVPTVTDIWQAVPLQADGEVAELTTLPDPFVAVHVVAAAGIAKAAPITNTRNPKLRFK